MKKKNKSFLIVVPGAVLGLLMGCTILGAVFGPGPLSIRTEGNLSSVRPGGTLRFSATGRGIVWSVSSTSDGTGSVSGGTGISSNGMLTVAAGETSIVLYVIAASTETGESVYKQIRVTTVTNVSITPQNQAVRRGRSIQFSALVTGSNNPDNAATWKVSSNPAGTGAVTQGTSINANGLLTVAAGETLTTLYVFASSVVDPSKSGSLAVAVIIPTVNSVAVIPVNQTVTSGGRLQFSATVTGTNDPSNAVSWRVSSNAAGTGAVAQGTGINANGLLTVAAGETARILYVFADSVEDPSKSGSVIVTVIVPVVSGVVVSSSGRSVSRGGTLQFSAAVTGTNNPSNAVSWSVSSNAAGTGTAARGTGINANGLLTVAADETAAVLFITAVSAADPSKSGNIAVTVLIPLVTGVIVGPPNQSVECGGSLQFTAAVTGMNNPDNGVSWSVSSNAAGNGAVTPGTRISANGLLTVAANETLTILYVIAASAADPGKSGSTAVMVLRNESGSGTQTNPGGNQNSTGGNQNNQGQNQNSQGQGQNSQGQNQNGQGQNQNNQGQNQQ